MKLLLVLGMLIFTGRANATGLTAGDYRDMCKSKDSTNQGFCSGYALGFMQGIDSIEISDQKIMARLHFTNGVNPQQIWLAVVAYIDKHPEVSNQSVNVVFVRALLAANLLRVTRENTCAPGKT